MSPPLARLVQVMSLVSVFIAPLILVNLLGIDWLIYRGLREAERADLFPPPLQYLDARTDDMGGLYYVPFRKEYCWGETVRWRTSAYNIADGVATVSYYLQSTHRYFFEGDRAAELENRYRGKKLEIISLYDEVGDTWHLREGTYIGGTRAFVLPAEKALTAPAPPGTRVRLWVEIDAAFSRGAGYHVDFTVARACKAAQL